LVIPFDTNQAAKVVEAASLVLPLELVCGIRGADVLDELAVRIIDSIKVVP
jgi:predicted nucleotidyltransferase